MPRTVIAATSIIAPLGPYPTLQPAANALDLVWQAADVANGNYFVLGTGKYLLMFRNVHATTAFNLTLTSIADKKGRTGDITNFVMQAGDVCAFLLDQQEGWLQSDGNFYLSGSDVSIQFCILRL